MEKIKSSITIDAPVEKVYNYLADHMNETEWLPSMVEITEFNGNEVGDTFKWKYKMAGIMLSGETTVEELVPNRRIATRSKGGASSYWVFDIKEEHGSTQLDLDIEYTLPVPVLGKIAEKAILKRNQRETDMALQNIKEILES